MIIEHTEFRQYIRETYEDVGKVSVYHISIDKGGLHSAWTPVKDEAEAYEVIDASGRLFYLYADEMDNYARMFMVPEENVASKNHLRDIVNPENLPGVGHFYREERERREMEVELKAKVEKKMGDLKKAFDDHHGKIWDQMNDINRQYGNIFDTGEGRGHYIASQNAPTLYSIIPRSSDLPLAKRLSHYAEVTGHHYVPSLDDDATAAERERQLNQQLRKDTFIEEHGYYPEIKRDGDFSSKTEAMIDFTLSDRSGPLVTAKVLFNESEDFTGCVEEPMVVAMEYHESGEIIEFDDEADYDDLAAAFSKFLDDAYGEEVWVVDPDNVGVRRAMSSYDEQELLEISRFTEMDNAIKVDWIIRDLENHPEIGENLGSRGKGMAMEEDPSPSL